MVRFRLRSQQTGQGRYFSLLDLLRLAGDTVNDEVRFNDGNSEDVFFLSSFEDFSIGAGGNGTGTGRPGTRLVSEAIFFAGGQKAFRTGGTPLSLCMVFLNGIRLRQGIDYNKNGREIELLFPLIAGAGHTDMLDVLYDIAA